MILEILLILLFEYLIYIISIMIHELFHMLSAIIFNVKIEGIYIGQQCYSINYKKLHISLLPKGGYINLNFDDLIKLSKIKIIILFISGAIGNVVLLILSLFIFTTIELKIFSVLLNLFFVLLNLLPINSSNDFSVLREYLKLI